MFFPSVRLGPACGLPPASAQIDNGEPGDDASLHSSLLGCHGLTDQPCAAIVPSSPSGGSPVVTLHPFGMQTELHPEWASQIDNGETGNDASLHSSLSGATGSMTNRAQQS